ncbi:hypothetical protein Halru_2826 [Halovivax ruber XH-70]|uniref:Uncharacterized protein n=1 Tax=Halovivax ruber (strain DSM 18193 / JCM 13892 / XH-70) TaxID=797302 RepID=L0IHF5_HALRX|nr:hypothetical protein [Halovivax ruber]AGB17397.1 hypothetical protein Halru_2826 [Halovivax ruber XH-70]
MSVQNTSSQERAEPSSDPRADYIHVGIDSEGAFHCYRTTDETVHVIEDGEVTYRYDLTSDRSINTWLDYVAHKRGWADQRLFKNPFGSLTERIWQ